MRQVRPTTACPTSSRPARSLGERICGERARDTDPGSARLTVYFDACRPSALPEHCIPTTIDIARIVAVTTTTAASPNSGLSAPASNSARRLQGTSRERIPIRAVIVVR